MAFPQPSPDPGEICQKSFKFSVVFFTSKYDIFLSFLVCIFESNKITYASMIFNCTLLHGMQTSSDTKKTKDIHN